MHIPPWLWFSQRRPDLPPVRRDVPVQHQLEGRAHRFLVLRHGPAHRASRERRARQMAPHDERRSELQLLRKAQEQRSRSDRRGRRIHQRELPRHQRRSPDPLALHQPADPNARRTAATFAAGLWHGHSTVAEYTRRSLPERTSVTSMFPNDGDGRKPKVAELCSNSANHRPSAFAKQSAYRTIVHHRMSWRTSHKASARETVPHSLILPPAAE